MVINDSPLKLVTDSGMLGIVAVGFIAATSFFGCGAQRPATVAVNGRITFQSQPVTQGNVVLENAARGWLLVSPLSQQGEFRFDSVKLGEYSLSVQPPDIKLPDETSGIQKQAAMAPKVIPDPENIPRRFRSSQSTPLRVDVTQTNSHFEFDLASNS